MATYEASSDIDNSVEMVDSRKTDLYDSDGETTGELGSPEDILTRVELDLAYADEKLQNLSLFSMQVANREGDFEAFVAASDGDDLASAGKALEFNLLSGILESVVSEVDQYLATLQTDIADVSNILSSCEYLGDISLVAEEKLQDCEELFKQLQDQVSAILVRSSEFGRILSSAHGKSTGNVETYSVEDEQCLNNKSMIDMKTAEHQRQILRMLEKSLAREMDHEKKLNESAQLGEELSHMLESVEQEVVIMDEEATDVWERCFAAENAAEILMAISKELLGRLQVVQFNLNCSSQREAHLKSRLRESSDQLDAKETALQKFNSSSSKLNDFLLAQSDSLKDKLADAEDKLVLANSQVFTLSEKVCLLEKQLKESEFQLMNAKDSEDGFQEEQNALDSEINQLVNVSEELKGKLSKAERQAENAEKKCKLLTETNMELNEEIDILKDKAEKVDMLEKQLKDSDIRIQHAMASAEASQEKQSMLYSTIGDMENLIEDLKLKVSKAESHADSVEDKCIILSESNAELNEELNYLRSRLGRLESFLNQSEESKLVTAKGISIRSKVMTDLVMQLAIERERLHKQFSSLASENRTLLMALQQKKKDPTVKPSNEGRGNNEKHVHRDKPVNCSKVQETQKTVLGGEGSTSGVVDVGVSNLKQVLMAVAVLIISATFYLLVPEKH
ncbi:WPP domain-interacting tail-anchored protein 1 [Linum grandiflorum]